MGDSSDILEQGRSLPDSLPQWVHPPNFAIKHETRSGVCVSSSCAATT
jgi:hypothetical protein